MKSLLILLSVMLSVPFAAQAKKETLSLLTVPGYSKIPAYKEVIDFITTVAADAGYDVKVMEAPRKRGPYMVSSGEADAMPIRGPDDATDVPNLINSNFPIAFTVFRVVSLQKNAKFDEMNLKNFSGAIILNNSSLQAEEKRRALKLIEVNVEYQGLLKMLLVGRVDYIVMPQEFIHGFIEEDRSLEKTLKVGKHEFVKVPLYFTMNKKYLKVMPKIEASFRKVMKGDLSRFKYIRHSLNQTLIPHPSPVANK